MPACLIEARKRAILTGKPPIFDGPRFGFTVTKKLGNAVTRNRIRRRLKAAISALAAANAEAGYDYVVVARAAAFDRPYSSIVADLTKAFAILHGRAAARPAHRSQNHPGKSAP